MKRSLPPLVPLPDPAAVFAAALSLWEASHELFDSASYDGMDDFMRQIMRVSTEFETWSCARVDFEQTEVAWPYFLQESFGDACLEVVDEYSLAQFNAKHCLPIAQRLSLPLRSDI